MNGGRYIHGGVDSSVRLRAARIVDLRVRRLVEPAHIEFLHSEVQAAIRSAGVSVLVCADFRFASPVSREVAGRWARAMRQSNSGVVRSGLLLDPANAVFNLQIERVVRCAGNPQRRFFADPDELRRWVGTELPGSERAALDELFGGGGISSV